MLEIPRTGRSGVRRAAGNTFQIMERNVKDRPGNGSPGSQACLPAQGRLGAWGLSPAPALPVLPGGHPRWPTAPVRGPPLRLQRRRCRSQRGLPDLIRELEPPDMQQNDSTRRPALKLSCHFRPLGQGRAPDTPLSAIRVSRWRPHHECGRKIPVSISEVFGAAPGPQ